MRGVVKCPKCRWRGFVAYYPEHFQERHGGKGYLDPLKVNSDEADSRPRPAADREEDETKEVKVYGTPAVLRGSSRKR